MGWLEWSAQIVASLAWPVAVVIILCVLRPAIVRLLRQISKLTWGDKAVDFSNGLDRLETTNTAVVDAAVTAADTQINKAEEKIASEKTVEQGKADEASDIGTRRRARVSRRIRERVSDESEFGLLLSVSPVSAVIDAWRPVEAAIMEVYDASGLAGAGPSFTSPQIMVKRLVGKGLISPAFHDSVVELSRLRNLAVHAGTGITTSDALRFKRNADIVVRELQSILRKVVRE